MKTATSGINRTRLNLFLDLVLALAFAVEMEEHFTGLRNHELLGLAFSAALLVHIVLHWQWIVCMAKTFFRNVLHESRLNYALNLALLLDVSVVVVTGLIISRTLGLNLGIEGGIWQRVHILAAELSLLFVGLHVALHWKWIAIYTKKYLFSFRLPTRKSPVLSSNRTVSTSEV